MSSRLLTCMILALPAAAWLAPAPTQAAPAAVQAAIEHQLLVENRKRLESEWKQSVRAACVIEVFPEVLTRIQGALESASPARPPVLE